MDNISQFSTRRERREQAKELTVSTWHNGQFGVWAWDDLTAHEKQEFLEARKHSSHVHLFDTGA